MIKIWVLVAHIIFANGSDDTAYGRHDPDWTSQSQCEENKETEAQWLKDHLPPGTQIEVTCEEHTLGPARDAA